MLNIVRVLKPWKEAASLNAQINLYGFWDATTFLTKSGDVGVVLRVGGVDYESLDSSEQEYAVKRLEAALKAFGPGFHVYQFLFKRNCPEIPFANYDDPVVATAVEQRRRFFEAKRDQLYSVEIFYCILLEGMRSKTGIGAGVARLITDPAGGLSELHSQFSNQSMKVLLASQIQRDCALLHQRVQAFVRQLADFVPMEILDQRGQLQFFRRLLNFDDWRIAGRPTSTQFLDYQVVNSDIEAERDHLRVGDHFVRVLTMKEAITETRPLVLDALLKISANFHVVTEWVPISMARARKEVTKRRRHFNISKTGFISQLGNDVTKTNPRDVLVDESKQADIENLVGLLGPVFIPFLVFDKLEFLFWGWLRAFIGFCFYKVLAAAVLSILAHLLAQYYSELANFSDPGNMVQELPLLILLVLVNIYILFKIPAMTMSIFSGSTGGHGGGMGGLITAAILRAI